MDIYNKPSHRNHQQLLNPKCHHSFKLHSNCKYNVLTFSENEYKTRVLPPKY